MTLVAVEENGVPIFVMRILINGLGAQQFEAIRAFISYWNLILHLIRHDQNMRYTFTPKPYLVALCFLLSACSPNGLSDKASNQSRSSKIPKSEHKAAWSSFASHAIVNDSDTVDVQMFAEQLSKLVDTSVQEWRVSKEYKTAQMNLPTLSNNTAKRERQTTKYKLFLLLLATSYGKDELHRVSQTLGPYDPVAKDEEAAYINSIRNLLDTFPVLEQGEMEVYYANNDEGLLAYSRQSDSARAYIAFNFSFSTQDMPLPFGFMASTKVAVWQSDSISATGSDIKRFVTQQTISIQALSAKIVIVE